MIFGETGLKGAFVLELEKFEDERGFFARTWCEKEFREHGLNPEIKQCNVSFNKRAGTLRGMHYQTAPFEEAKLVRVTSGSIFDVIIDLRKESPTFKQSYSIVLSADNAKMLYIPEGFAHGFQTMTDNTEVFYQMSEFFQSDSARGVRWNDPAFKIAWPEVQARLMSERDANYPNFTD